MTAGKKIQRLIIVVIVGLLTITGKAQTPDSVMTISDSIFVTQTNITIHNLTNDTVSLKVFSMTGNIVNDFFENIVLSGTITITFNADTLADGMYLVVLTLNGDNISKRVIKNSSQNYDLLNINNELTIYPVPTSDNVFIKTSRKITDIQIYDCNGQKVKEQININNNKVDLTELKNGIYLLYLMTEDKLFIEKVIKQ